MTDLKARDIMYFLWALTNTAFLKNPRFAIPDTSVMLTYKVAVSLKFKV
jgi:hypothetical protein